MKPWSEVTCGSESQMPPHRPSRRGRREGAAKGGRAAGSLPRWAVGPWGGEVWDPGKGG